MGKLAHILAVEIEKPTFSGFVRLNAMEHLSQGTIWIGPRPHLEELDPSQFPEGRKAILQIIPYVIVRNEGEVLAYVRPSSGNESRLHGKVSVGLGGHVDLEDIVHNDSIINLDLTLRKACVRELQEEIGLEFDPTKINWSGLIYRTDGPVDRVHIGIVAEVEITEEEKQKIESTEEIGQIRFLAPSNVENHMAQYEVETWSKSYLSLI